MKAGKSKMKMVKWARRWEMQREMGSGRHERMVVRRGGGSSKWIGWNRRCVKERQQS